MFNTECSSCFESLDMFPVKKKKKTQTEFEFGFLKPRYILF